VLGGSIALQKKRRITLVGIFHAGDSAYDSEVWADLDTVRTSFNFQGYLSSVTAELESPRAFDAFEAALENDKRQGLEVERERDYYLKVSEDLSSVIAVLGGITGCRAPSPRSPAFCCPAPGPCRRRAQARSRP
jgi:ABC-type lipoprotein release transport system permease subunit